MTIVVVSTHFDDAVLSCWHVLTGAEDVEVVTVFTAAPDDADLQTRWDRDTGVSSQVRMAQRVAENEAALAVAGRTATNVGLLEGQYGGGIVEADALRPYLEAADVVYLPAAVFLRGANTEHEAVRDAGLTIRPDATLYADQPYCLFRSDVELPVERRQGREHIEVRLTADERERKAEAITCYAGELAKLESFFGPFSDPDRLLGEALWRPVRAE
jgi:hypothetical protein